MSVLVALCLMVPPARTEELTELRDSFLAQTSLLNGDIEAYSSARSREREAIDELRRLNAALDDLMADPNAGPRDLARLEAEVTVAREEVFAWSTESAEARGQLYQRMENLGAILQRAEREGIAVVPTAGDVGGMWRIEAQPGDLWGFLSLRQDRQLVSGTYRLSNGRRGSMTGTFAGGRLALEMIDSQRGLVGSVEGEPDSGTGDIDGTWQAMELAGGGPASGSWTAHRLSLREDLGFE